jgi:hypothetical protein
MNRLLMPIILFTLTAQLWGAVIPDGKAVPREAGAPELPTSTATGHSKSPSPLPDLSSKRPHSTPNDPNSSGRPSDTKGVEPKTAKSSQSQGRGTGDQSSRPTDLPLTSQRSLSLGTLGATTLKGRTDRED